MKTQSLSSQSRGRALLINLLMITTVLTSSYVAVPQPLQQGPSPSLVLEAPAQVEVGNRIEVQLIMSW